MYYRVYIKTTESECVVVTKYKGRKVCCLTFRTSYKNIE